MELELELVVKNGIGQYLIDVSVYEEYEEWGTKKDADRYSSTHVFDDAQIVNGKVFILLPNGREIEVSKEDFI